MRIKRDEYGTFIEKQGSAWHPINPAGWYRYPEIQKELKRLAQICEKKGHKLFDYFGWCTRCYKGYIVKK